jgi:hypothetical protein
LRTEPAEAAVTMATRKCGGASLAGHLLGPGRTTSATMVAGRPAGVVPSGRRSAVPWDHQAALVGQDDGLGAVTQVQLGEHAGGVGLDRVFADDQTLGDLETRASPSTSIIVIPADQATLQTSSSRSHVSGLVPGVEEPCEGCGKVPVQG